MLRAPTSYTASPTYAATPTYAAAPTNYAAAPMVQDVARHVPRIETQVVERAVEVPHTQQVEMVAEALLVQNQGLASSSSPLLPSVSRANQGWPIRGLSML